MSKVRIQNLNKSYDQTSVLSQISINVEDGEFIVIVGPSGCGKSTLLRTIAGLEEVTSGDIWIDDQRVTHTHPSQRNIAMVFQEYALYPHMTVLDNIRFGLKLKKLDRNEIQRRVEEVSSLLHIQDILYRKPSQLSGGQRQRVAIGRALAKKPKVFLFDEPFSNIDAQLRTQMRIELSSLHRQIGSTTLFVTHDQGEAMTLADRIIVLNSGTVQQVGSPIAIYNHPENKFVASFIGSPEMNLIPGKLKFIFNRFKFEFEQGRIDLNRTPKLEDSRNEVVLGIRPENISLSDSAASDLRVRVIMVERYGFETHLICVLGSTQIALRISDARLRDKVSSLQVGDEVNIHLNREKILWFSVNDEGKQLREVSTFNEKEMSFH